MSNLVPSMSFSSLYGFVPSQLRPGLAQQRRPSSDADEHEDLAVDDEYNALQKSSRAASRTQSSTQVGTAASTTTAKRSTATVPARISEAELQLSAECPHCSNDVVIRVPKYMMQAMAPAGRMLTPDQEWDSRRVGVVNGDLDKVDTARERIVNMAVRAATAFKESRLPALMAGCIRATVALVIYLDQTFSIHQRLIMVFWIVLADLQRIEQEVGLLRNSGDAISVLWEAFVKGAIALGKPDLRPGARTQEGQGHPMNGQFTQSYPYATSPAPTPLNGPPAPNGYLQPSFSYTGDREDGIDYSTGETSSSDLEITSRSGGRHQQPAPKRTKTLRRMANSVPSFHEGGGARSGSTTPNGDGLRSSHSSSTALSSANEYFSDRPGARPRIGRARSRSGPDETSREELNKTPIARERGWVASKMVNVAGAVLPRMG